MKREVETKFYKFRQNNSGGYYDDDENVAAIVVIEALDEKHAMSIMEPLIENCSPSCSCCGDRWSLYLSDEIEEEDMLKGCNAEIYTHYKDCKERWFYLYGEFDREEEPRVKPNHFKQEVFGAKCTFKNIEEYLQFEANNYFLSSNNAVIHYMDGIKKKFFSKIYKKDEVSTDKK